jgi:ABC-type bacteriocin/lantibiotic exporter with double-glycine peptidase domain
MIVRMISVGVLFLLYSCGTEKEMRLLQWQAIVLDSAGVVFQQTNEDCGVACAFMILQREEKSGLTYDQISAQLHRTTGGISMRELREFFATRQIPSAGMRLKIEDLRRIPHPAILLVENNHYVVYDGFRPDGKILLRDPTMGRLLLEKMGFARIWGGEALVIAGT